MRILVTRSVFFASLAALSLVAACAPARSARSADAPGPREGGKRLVVAEGHGVTNSAGGAPDLSEDPRLADLLRLALERSPAVEAARERALAAAETSSVEGWLPNPEAVVGWYETPVQTRVGPQEWSIGVRQMIPFPSKLITKAGIADRDADRMRVTYERLTRDVLVDVVLVAHELAYLDEASRITADIEKLLQRYMAAAAAGEHGLTTELFRAETQRAQLENDRVVIAELRVVEAQRLAGLLNLPRGAVIGTPRTEALPAVRATMPELLVIAERHAHELREAEFAVEAARLRTSLARQSRIPDLSVGVTRIGTERLPGTLGMNPSGNGDDPLIFQLGITLPLWVHRDSAAIRRALSLQHAASLDRSDAIQRTRDRVARAWFQVGAAERLHRLYADVLVPRASLAARTAEDLLANGKGSLAGLLETIAVHHNFRLAGARAYADHGRAIAELERAIGRPLTVDLRETAPEGGE